MQCGPVSQTSNSTRQRLKCDPKIDHACDFLRKGSEIDAKLHQIRRRADANTRHLSTTEERGVRAANGGQLERVLVFWADPHSTAIVSSRIGVPTRTIHRSKIMLRV